MVTVEKFNYQAGVIRLSLLTSTIVLKVKEKVKRALITVFFQIPG